MPERRNPFAAFADLAEVQFSAGYDQRTLCHDLRRTFDSDHGRRALVWLMAHGGLLAPPPGPYSPPDTRVWADAQRALVRDLLTLLTYEPAAGHGSTDEDDPWSLSV